MHKKITQVKESLLQSLPESVRTFFRVLGESSVLWYESQPFRNAAVIAYYAIFSLPGLLLIIINLVSIFYGREIVVERIIDQVQSVIGPDTAESIRVIISNARQETDSLLATLIGICVLLFGATGVFYQIQQTLNQVWEVQAQAEAKWYKVLVDRLFSFGLVITLGFLLLVSLLLSTAMGVFSEWISNRFGSGINIFFRVINMGLSVMVISILFAAIFKFIPDAEVRLRDVWVGSLFTAVLFVASEFLLSLYFGHSDPGSSYGAAGSLILILLWFSYNSMILLFGAQFTRSYSLHFGDGQIIPSDIAENVSNSEP